MEDVMKLLLINVTTARILASKVYSFLEEGNWFELYGTDDVRISREVNAAVAVDALNPAAARILASEFKGNQFKSCGIK